MVKTPRTRHSASPRDPVTIDLAPGEVSRVKAEAENAQDPAADPVTAETKAETADAGHDQPAPEASVDEQPPLGERQGEARPEDAASGTPDTGRGGTGMLAAGAAGGVIALLLAGGLHVAGLLPLGGDAPREDPAAIAALETQLAQLREQVAALEGAGGEDPALAGRITQTEERIEALATEIEAVRGEVAQAGQGGATVDLAPFETRIAAVEAAVAALGGEGAGQVDLGAVEESIAGLREDITSAREGQAAASARLDALEQTVARLDERLAEQAEAPATAIIIAASALKAAIDRGTPFATELDTFASLAPEAPQVEALKPYAAEGVATRAQLAAESDAAANAMIAAARPTDTEAGVINRLWASAMGLVQVRPIGMVEGEGVPETAARLDAAVQAGDYERAAAEFETLPQAAKTAGQDFMARLRARHEADRLIDEALAAALRA